MKLYQTTFKGDFLVEKRLEDLSDADIFEKKSNTTLYTDSGELHKIYFDITKTFQTWEGFGGAFTESAAYALNAMSSDKQKIMMEAYFHPQRGIGYNLGRTHINSCDFSLGNWSCCDVEDKDLKMFNLNRYKHQIIPMLKWAQSLSQENITLFASPWSPPAWMKTNGEMNNGGKVKEKYKKTWANFYCKYIQSMQKEGINISAITVQNEPAAQQVWDSCLYSPEEERDFVKYYLGPALEQQRLGNIKILCWDHNRAEAFERAQKMFDDPIASKYVYGIGIHWYMGDNYQNLKLINDLYSNKKIWFTEGCQEAGPHIGDWKVAERYAHSIINDLNHNTSVWCDWNLFLDETGGPNHVNNLCSAPILVDTQHDEVIFNPSYYYLAHFSKFIQRGAKRIAVCSSTDSLETTGFINPNNNTVIVVCNSSNKSMSYRIQTQNKKGNVNIPARSIQTLIF